MFQPIPLQHPVFDPIKISASVPGVKVHNEPVPLVGPFNWNWSYIDCAHYRLSEIVDTMLKMSDIYSWWILGWVIVKVQILIQHILPGIQC